MPYYRLYFMSVHGGHIERFAEFEVADDEAAIERARKHQGAQPLEMWCGKRKVCRLETDAASARMLKAAL